MATLPEDAFGGRIVKQVKNSIYRYGIIAVVLIELLSILLKAFDVYTLSMYYFLTQLACAILVYNNCYENKPKKLCIRKRIAYKVLAFYYVFGIGCMAFGMEHGFYQYVVNPLLLGTALILILYTVKNE